MADERRNARRARLSGIHVTYESANGEHAHAEASDLSPEGLFIAADAPLPVGKRISIEIQAVGERVPWAALGRVVWVRAAREGNDRPAGMGIRIIDMEESVAKAIERLLESRDPTAPGLGSLTGNIIPPLREQTIVGVGAIVEPPRAAAPVRVAPPGREATILGIGLPAVGAGDAPGTSAPSASGGEGAGIEREASLAVDLVTRRPSTRPPAEPPPPAGNASESSPAEPSAVDAAPVAEAGGAPAPTPEPSPATAAAATPAPAAASEPPPRAATVSSQPPPSSVSERPPRSGGRAAERAARARAPGSKSERTEAAAQRIATARASMPPPRPKSSGAVWIVLVLLVGGAGAAYAFREPLLVWWDGVTGASTPSATATVAAPTPTIPAATTSATTPEPAASATTAVSGAALGSASPSGSESAPAHPSATPGPSSHTVPPAPSSHATPSATASTGPAPSSSAKHAPSGAPTAVWHRPKPADDTAPASPGNPY